MIAKLTGFIDNIIDDKCIIDVNGVGYLVYISSKSINIIRNSPKEQKTSLIIETIYKQDSIELFGFIDENEKNWFIELSKVQGLGAKIAQKILGHYNINEICNALLRSDSKFFSQISGIGPKLANRITMELKDSPKKIATSHFIIDNDESFQSNISNDQIIDDALSALENLGYKKHECSKVIQLIFKNEPNTTLENLITNSLRSLKK